MELPRSFCYRITIQQTTLRRTMAEIAFITILGELLLPLALLSWSWRGICGNRVEWLLKTLSLAAYLVLIAVAGVWLLLPWYLPYGFAILGLAAVTAAWGRCRRPSPGIRGAKIRRWWPRGC